MTLTTLTGAGLALGLAALALGLYLLQRIRVRHEEFLVVTTLFWREARQESRARTLVERFRHPLAYALALLLAGLLWLAVAGPDSARERGTQHVLLLDGSAGMALPGRFDAAVAALTAELADSPRDRTEVLWCGADVRTLLAAGEDRALLAARTLGLAPEAVPASLERAVRERAPVQRGAGADAHVRFVVFGDAPLRESALDAAQPSASASPGALTVERAALADARGGVARGLGVTALGVAPAASSEWTSVDVFVELRGPGADSAELAVTVGDAPFDASAGVAALRSVIAPDHATFALRDVPAQGGLLAVEVADALGLPADDRAAVRLPNRPRIRVALAAGLDADLGVDGASALRMALGVDAAVELVADGAPADVRIAADTAPGPGATLAFVPASAQVEAILVGHSAGLDSRGVLERAVGELGLDRLDAAALASELGRPLTVGAAPLAMGGGSATSEPSVASSAPPRRIALWRELVTGGAPSFLEDRAFPLLVGRAVRWLADAEAVVPYAAVGRPAPRRVGLAFAASGAAHGAAAGAASDDASSAAAIVRLGDPASGLLDLATTDPAVLGADPLDAFASLAGSAPEGAGPWRPMTWILLLACALLGVEWALFQRGRMP